MAIATFQLPTCLATDPVATMAYDTNVKFSGSGSIRHEFPPHCQVDETSNQCGGSSDDGQFHARIIYGRVYFRMSGTGPNPGPIGKFETSITAFTKLLKHRQLMVSMAGIGGCWGVAGVKISSSDLKNVPAA